MIEDKTGKININYCGSCIRVIEQWIIIYYENEQ